MTGGKASGNEGSASERVRGSGVPERNGGVSIKSVAERAGVSIATVSRVINTPDLVAPETSRRVQAAIAEVGYRPNLFAKGLLTRRSRVIGVSLPDIHGQFYSDLMRSADERACELGYHLLVSSNAHRPDVGPESSFALDLADGLIVMLTESSRADLDAIARLSLPTVVIGADKPGLGLETITIDNASGVREAVEHLLAGTPAERCCFVGGHRGNIDSDERCAAFIETLRAHGHEPSVEQVALGEYGFDWGWEWATAALNAERLRGSAVLTANDEIAIGVASAARDAGLLIPRDVRLVGFDDSALCRFMRPPLSSVRVPIDEIGQEAVNALVRRLENPKSTPRRACLQTALVVRESSAVGRTR